MDIEDEDFKQPSVAQKENSSLKFENKSGETADEEEKQFETGQAIFE